MSRIARPLLLFLLSISVLFIGTRAYDIPQVFAQSCDQYDCDEDDDEDEYLECIDDKRECLEDVLEETKGQKITLTNTINVINGQINIQEVEIKQLNAQVSKLRGQVELLSQRISGLASSLDQLSAILVTRIRTQYKQRNISPLTILFEADSAKDAFANYKYLSYAGQHTADAMQRAEIQRLDLDAQKQLKEEAQIALESKQAQLVAKQNQLSQQRVEQQYLLNETQNNEAKYQRELAKTLAEINAIQSIIAGKGSETKVGDVEEGDKIASVIYGASTCSSGSHLHFEVARGGTNRDPAGYLEPESIVWSNSPDGSFGFGGDWRWPLDDAARITQGYGMTYYARVRRAYGGAPHTGIDMVSKTGKLTVRAVEDGTLYRGSIACGGGLLRYVRVRHDDNSDISTYYLHVNYI